MKVATTVLVVDDNEPTRYALCRMLQVHGYSVEQAATGAETLREAEKKPDLIILDIHLPDANGYDICRKLKAAPRTASIPVLHLSATFADSESRSAGLEHGADGYLTYPVEPRELVATVEAILRARRAERLAREQNELLRVTLASIGDGVIATDLEGKVTFLNPVAEMLTGSTQAGAVGQALENVYRLVSEETRQPQRFGADTVAKVLLVAKNGVERPVEQKSATIQDSDGNSVGTVVVFRDVTERRQAERVLVDSNRQKDEFLAMLAHELRNPLAPIRNAVQVLNLISSQEPAAASARALIERQVEQLVRIVDNLLDVSRITRGLVKLQKEPVDLALVIARAVESSKPLIDARRHILEIKLPDAPLPVLGDVVRLAQIFLNLLNNAAKYTPEGGRIALTAEERAGRRVAVRVQDTGMGIPTEAIGRIFDLFSQMEGTLERSDGGLGLGLTLVRRLTEMHGGNVSVSSPGPGQGSEFLVELPLIEASELRRNEAANLFSLKTAPIPGRRILVIDDNRDAADSLAILLRLFGHDVRSLYDGRQALTVAASYRPHLILLDLGLPGLSGLEVAKQLRQINGLNDVVIVALTGYGSETDRRRSQDAGFNAHFTKPIDLTRLEELLRDPSLGASTR
jgi:PAS domain S-box-containing protein